MKLIYKVILRASVGMAVIMVCWAVLFYFGMTKVINDEIDDMLSEFSEQLIVRFLSGIAASPLRGQGDVHLPYRRPRGITCDENHILRP